MKAKSVFFVMALLVAISAFAVTNVAADETWNVSGTPDILWMEVYVNGMEFWEGNCELSTSDPVNAVCTAGQVGNELPALERGERMKVQVIFAVANDVEEVSIESFIKGYREDIETETAEFDAYPGRVYKKVMYLDLPSDLDAEEDYTLYVEFNSRTTLTGPSEARIDTVVQRVSNILDILDVQVSDNCPTGTCGKLYANVVVKNRGNHKLEDIFVRATIEGTGLYGQAYLEDLYPVDNEDEEDTKTIRVEIPLANLQTGIYTLEVRAYTDEYSTVETIDFFYQKDSVNTGGIEIDPQVTRKDVNAGESVVYSLIVRNNGDSTKTFVVETIGLNWATAQITPATFSLGPGESRLVSVAVNANSDATEGEHLFTIRVNDQSFSYVADVGGYADLSLNSVLMIIGIVLAVAIVILLIVVLARKPMAVEERPEESYY
ncbi:MAG: hypothetical protein ABH817_02495 [archaeon]